MRSIWRVEIKSFFKRLFRSSKTESVGCCWARRLTYEVVFVFFLATFFVELLVFTGGGLANGSTAILKIFFGDSSVLFELAYSFSFMLALDPLADKLLLLDLGSELVL